MIWFTPSTLCLCAQHYRIRTLLFAGTYSRGPSWKYNAISKPDSVNRCVLFYLKNTHTCSFNEENWPTQACAMQVILYHRDSGKIVIVTVLISFCSDLKRRSFWLFWRGRHRQTRRRRRRNTRWVQYGISSWSNNIRSAMHENGTIRQCWIFWRSNQLFRLNLIG